MEKTGPAALVTGAAGMLGRELMRVAPAGAVGVDRDDGDLSDPDDVARLFRERGPFRAVLHAAGYTDVDGAESEAERAYRDNALAACELAAACKRAGTPFLLVSTDFVFDGRAKRPYRPGDRPAPQSAYGRTKLAGELAAQAVHPEGTRIVRTAWLYGEGGRHFPGAILAAAAERPVLRVVDDQVGSPTSTEVLAPVLWRILLEGGPGIYHATCSRSCSRHEWARAILELAGVEGVEVEPCRTREYPRPAARPAYSVLDCSGTEALLGEPLAPWRDALARYLGGRARK